MSSRWPLLISKDQLAEIKAQKVVAWRIDDLAANMIEDEKEILLVPMDAEGLETSTEAFKAGDLWLLNLFRTIGRMFKQAVPARVLYLHSYATTIPELTGIPVQYHIAHLQLIEDETENLY